MLGNIKRKVAAKAMGVSDRQMAEMETMQRQIAEIVHKYEQDGIVVKMSGDMKIQYLVVNGEEREDIKKAINKAHEGMQKELAKKMMEMSGGLGGLLGNLGK